MLPSTHCRKHLCCSYTVWNQKKKAAGFYSHLFPASPSHCFFDLFLSLCAGMPSILDWTDDGFSMCFGVNHLGHFLLTNLLLPRLKECAPSRVVTLTCSTYKYQKLDFQDLNYNLLPFFTYCRSKLANIYFSQELARIADGKGVTSYAVHPGKNLLSTVLFNQFLLCLLSIICLEVEWLKIIKRFCFTLPSLSFKRYIFLTELAVLL